MRIKEKMKKARRQNKVDIKVKKRVKNKQNKVKKMQNECFGFCNKETL